MKTPTTQAIVVPVDFSEGSAQAVAAAIALASEGQAIHLVHVLGAVTDIDGWSAQIDEARADAAGGRLASLAIDAGRPDLKTEVVRGGIGNPAADIAMAAERLGAGLIVIPAHGLTWVERLITGSVSQRVVRLAPCPVLMLRGDRPGSTAPDKYPARAESIAVPFDFSDAAEAALDAAADIVGDGSKLHVINVLQAIPAGAPEVMWDDSFDHRRREAVTGAIGEMLERHDLASASAHTAVSNGGNPAQHIVRLADHVDADLIVMPTHGRTGFKRLLLGSVTERVLRTANCPVLVLRA